jgi:hypothetical protein
MIQQPFWQNEILVWKYEFEVYEAHDDGRLLQPLYVDEKAEGETKG